MGSKGHWTTNAIGAAAAAGRLPVCPGFKVSRVGISHNHFREPENSGGALGIMGMSVQQHAPEPSWTDAWISVRDRLRLELGQGIFDTWIAPLSMVAAADGAVRLSSPSRLVRDYTASHH